MFKSIKQYQPANIYIAADGPRNVEEKNLTDQCRGIVEEEISWPCSVHKLYRDQNLGLRIAVSQAVTWFFENEKWGIILEDDCLPTHEFFNFTRSRLMEYEDDSTIMHLSGNNLQPKNFPGYHFSKYPRVWGWATWRRAWKYYDDSDSFLDKLDNQIIKSMYPRWIDRAFWTIIIEKMKLPNGSLKKRSWAYFWALNIRYHNGRCIQPNQNLIQNVGFGENATNTKDQNRLKRLSNINPSPSFDSKGISPHSRQISEVQDNQFVNEILIDSRIKLLKVYLKVLLPFLKPRR
ncbi:hypothetical protein [Marinoscillum sp. MHG1-6]|uniref:hypothetical protein n=1 Tax=Marinoscillum sp. MHG1-6 TaxID=2959627 RepID=UPI0021571727|nr:hypothetical protein [Marinoscillum sp. MHG1-6]